MIWGLGGVGDWVGDGCLGWGKGYSATRARLVNHHGRSKYKRFPCNFFENRHMVGQNTKDFLVIFSKIVKNPKISRNVRNFLTKLIFLFFFHFFTKDTLKRLLGGPKSLRMIYKVVFKK